MLARGYAHFTLTIPCNKHHRNTNNVHVSHIHYVVHESIAIRQREPCGMLQGRHRTDGRGQQRTAEDSRGQQRTAEDSRGQQRTRQQDDKTTQRTTEDSRGQRRTRQQDETRGGQDGKMWTGYQRWIFSGCSHSTTIKINILIQTLFTRTLRLSDSSFIVLTGQEAGQRADEEGYHQYMDV
ncbi:MAG: hypothetical protein J3Q66DRAFT_127715 [Benniella sp.]|nr:MAG: hypothetical protein J3Q66DRAFT_127715 [Benniella sp.]